MIYTPENPPRTIDDLDPPPWLRPADLQGRELTLVISRIDWDNFPTRPGNYTSFELCPILYFSGKTKGLILNKQKRSETGIATQTNVFDDMIGKAIRIYAEPGRNGTDRIVIAPPHLPDASV